MILITSINKRLENLSRGSLRFIRLALLVLLFAGSQSHSQEAESESQIDEPLPGGVVSLADLPGKRIDRDWFRYVNPRFGLAIDIPARGYRYVLPVNGSGMAVTSGDEKIWITIYAHFVVNHPVFFTNPDDPDLANAAASISRIYDHEVAETLAAGSAIIYRMKNEHFFVLSGQFEDTTYYERMAISPRCPHVFNRFRITYPKSKERELSKFVTRLSLSLLATCQGEDAAPGNKH